MSFNVQEVSGFAGSLDIARQVTIQSAAYQIERADDVIVQTAGKDLTLPVSRPSTPTQPGADLTTSLLYIVMADNLPCTVLGGPNLINGKSSLRVPAETYATIVWNGAEWVAMLSGTGSPSALSQSAWFIAPVTGNDNADGLTPATPIKTYAELALRWGGTTSPTFSQGGIMRVKFLESQPGFTDPVRFTPTSYNGTQPIIEGALLPAGSGVFDAVTLRNRGAWNMATALVYSVHSLAIDLTTQIGKLCHDITTDAWFWLDAPGGAGVEVTQPLAKAAFEIPATNFTPIELGIANGDSFELFDVPSVYMAELGGLQVGSDPTLENMTTLVHVRGTSSQGLGGDAFYFGNGPVQIAECDFECFPESRGSWAGSNVPGLNTSPLVNVRAAGGIDLQAVSMWGGGFNGGSISQSTSLDGDVVVRGSPQTNGNNVFFGLVNFHDAVPCLFESTRIFVRPGGILWGLGTVQLDSSKLELSAGDSAAVVILVQAITIDGGTSGLTVTAPGVWAAGSIAPPSNIDAAPGKAIGNPLGGSTIFVGSV